MKHRRKRRGQVMIELAIVLPVMFVLALLIVQYSVLMNTAASVTNLSREGARYAARAPESDSAIKQQVRDAVPNGITITDDDITISPASTANRSQGLPITVSVSYDMSKKHFLPANFFGLRIFAQSYVSSTTMMIE